MSYVHLSPSHAEATAVSHGAQLHRPPAGTRRLSPTHLYSFFCMHFLSFLSFPFPEVLSPSLTVEMPTPQQRPHTCRYSHSRT